MKLVQLVALCAVLTVVDGAALVRFVNTVPATISSQALHPGTTTVPTLLAAGVPATTYPRIETGTSYPTDMLERNFLQDVVGLLVPESATSVLATNAYVQTQSFNHMGLLSTSTTLDHMAWWNGMLPLRGDHDHASSAIVSLALDTATVNRLCAPHLWAGAASAADTVEGTVLPTVVDLYHGEYLRADGIMGYLSFAAGSYTFTAYGVKGHTCGSTGSCVATPDGVTATSGILTTANTARTEVTFSNSQTTVTLVSDKTYNIVAIGDADWTNAGGGSGAWNPTVSLVLTEESTAKASWSRAAFRFMHAANKHASSALTIFAGRTVARATEVVASLAFGAVSSYLDIEPSRTMIFPVSVDGSVQEKSTEVTLDVRAGSRATVICAHADENLQKLFCRQIPSRVVAYVRLINALGSSSMRIPDSLFEPKCADSSLSLVASYATPVSKLGALTQGSAPMEFNVPPVAHQDEVYSVVSGVTSNTVSGFGDVHVPLPIMDFALNPQITFPQLAADSTSNEATGHAVTGVGVPPSGKGGATAWHNNFMTPIYKRVTMGVRTSQNFNLGNAPIVDAAYDAVGVPSSEQLAPGGHTFGDTVAQAATTTATLGVKATTGVPAHIQVISTAVTAATTAAVDSMVGYRIALRSVTDHICPYDGYVGTIVGSTANVQTLQVQPALPNANEMPAKNVGDCTVTIFYPDGSDLHAVTMTTQFMEPGTAISVGYGHSHRTVITSATCTTAVDRGSAHSSDYEISIGVSFSLEQFETEIASGKASWALEPTSWRNIYTSAAAASATANQFTTAPIVSDVVSSTTTDVTTITGYGTAITTTAIWQAAQGVTGSRWSLAGVVAHAAGAAATTQMHNGAGSGGVSYMDPSTQTPTPHNSLASGSSYRLTQDVVTGHASTIRACWVTIPSNLNVPLTDSGAVYTTHVFGMNECVCSTGTSFDTTVLSGQTIKWGYATAAAVVAPAAVATPFFGSAPANSAPVVLLFAAVLAVLAVAF